MAANVDKGRGPHDVQRNVGTFADAASDAAPAEEPVDGFSVLAVVPEFHHVPAPGRETVQEALQAALVGAEVGR